MRHPIICIVVLTKDEEVHLQRCLRSVLQLSELVYIVDSFSSDHTVEIARRHGCVVAQRHFTNHAEQFNWAMDTIPWDVDWVLRIDADEWLSNALLSEIKSSPILGRDELLGIYLKRRFIIDSNEVIHGFAPSKIIRIIRPSVRYPLSSMDEAFDIPDYQLGILTNLFFDESLKPFSWWIDKHWTYSRKEALKYVLSTNLVRSSFPQYHGYSLRPDRRKRIYYRQPPFLRALLLYLYRQLIMGGFFAPRSHQAFLFYGTLLYRLSVDMWISIYMTSLKGALKASVVPVSFEHDLQCFMPSP